MSREILIVDDDALLRRSLAFHLEQAGYTVHPVANGEDALAYIRRRPPGLVILDVGLPGMDGLDALKAIKRECDIPVIFLTARRRELDEVVGLELGADDYVTKPFDVDVLLAHIKAVLRRVAIGSSPPPALATLEVADLRIDPASRKVALGGQDLELSPREFDLLYALASTAGQVVATDQLLTQVWGAEFAGQPQVLYTHIRWLRKKLEQDPDHPERILTVRGVGYRLVPIDPAE